MTTKDNIREAEIRGSDPSELTTQMMVRQIAALKELLTSEIDGLKKATDVAHEDLVRVPTDVQKQVLNLRELAFEKIDNTNKTLMIYVATIEKQFEWIERQRLEQKADTRTAVDDALRAAKELGIQQNVANNNVNAKTEAAFIKQMDTLVQVMTLGANTANQRHDDLKQRVDKQEGRGGGFKDFGGWIFGAIAILFYLLNYLKT